MTILGRSAILESFAAGTIVVSPILSARQIGAASVDVRMGAVVLMVKSRGASHVDPAKRSNQEPAHARVLSTQQKHERYEIPFQSRFLLHPGALALVPTLEWIRLPADISGTVTARSTWAREGLSIATATLIEPGYDGTVTLELANLGEIPIALYPGLRLAQIAFIRTEGDTARPQPGQFQTSFEPRQGDVGGDDDSVFAPAHKAS